MEGIDYLNAILTRGSRPGLERICSALKALGNPQDKLNVINVTGTNGKGSFCAMLAGALSQSYRVGVFSSPYLESITESICVNGMDISENELSDLAREYKGISEQFELTQFEYLTVLSILYFIDQKTDIAIYEVGMGGGKDATNVFKKNLLSVFTGISLDHTQILGNDVEKIAKEKSGIIKENCPVYFGGNQNSKAAAVIKEAAIKKSCKFFGKETNEHTVFLQSPDRNIFSYKGKEYKLPFGGTYQIENAEKVIDCIEILGQSGYHLSYEDTKKGFCGVKRKGRFEVFSYDPYIIFDGGHNVECLQAFAECYKTYFGKRKSDFIVGVMADKEHMEMVKLLAEFTNCVYTVSPDNPRALDAKALSDEFHLFGCNSVPAESFEKALEMWSNNGSVNLFCVGSLYSYKAFKSALERKLSNKEN